MPKIKHIARAAQDSGPDSVMVDVSGWVGASGFRPQ
jgi:hypothetical protein